MKTRTLDLFSTAVALLCFAAPAFAGAVVTPEPTTVILMGGGLGAILVVRHLRTKKK